ncbi:MAG: nitrilase-related carbon-nitrogen hydrolase [Pseudomonadota bacterium]
MRLALHQGPSPAGDVGAAFADIDRALGVAAAAGADMALMPELFLPGYNHEPMAADPEWETRLADRVALNGVALTIGLAEARDGVLRNTALVFGPDGRTLQRFDKLMLWGPREKDHFAPGEAIVCFNFAGRRIGLAICYDIEFPEIGRAYARAGADLILVPTGNPAPYDGISRFTVPAMANINTLSIAYANYCGDERGATYCGQSVIVGPDGEVLASAGLGPAILIADIPARDDATLRPLSTQLDDLGGGG